MKKLNVKKKYPLVSINSENIKKAYNKTNLAGIFYLKIKAPLFIQFELTYRCNQKCIFCYNVWKESIDTPKVESISRKKQLEILHKIIKNETFGLIFSGGEPLLVDWLEDLIEKASQENIETSLVTNAVLLSKERAKKIKDSGLSSIQISLHHYLESINNDLVNKNSFKKTATGINNAINILGAEKVNVNMVVLPSTVKDVYEMGKYLSSKGLRYFSVGTPTVTGVMLKNKDIVINKQHFKDVYFQLVAVEKDFGINTSFTGGFPLCILPEINDHSIGMVNNFCDAGLNQVVVEPNGNLRPCVCFNYNLGNILEGDLKKIWKDNKLLSNMRKLAYLPIECKKCSYVHLCRGGCRASAFSYYENMYAIDPLMR